MRYKRAKHTAWRTISGQAFIVNTKTSTLHELNDVGTAIWECLRRPVTLDDISRHLVDVFETTLPEARKDTDDFLRQLTKTGLIDHVS